MYTVVNTNFFFFGEFRDVVLEKKGGSVRAGEEYIVIKKKAGSEKFWVDSVDTILKIENLKWIERKRM